jgi:metal transporter CNNM
MIQIYRRGYSRIPVYDRNPNHDDIHDDDEEDKGNICGILLTKQLIVLNASDRRRVGSLPLQQPVCVGPGTNLVDLINIFQKGGSASKGGHLALVCARPAIATNALHHQNPIPHTAGVMGILTMEDVLEELIQEQIYDEMVCPIILLIIILAHSIKKMNVPLKLTASQLFFVLWSVTIDCI